MVGGREQARMRDRPEQVRPTAAKLGVTLQEVVASRISPAHSKFTAVSKVLECSLPGKVWRHCRITGISRGKLSVAVDSPSYRYELQLLSAEVVNELQRQCPQAGIREIVIIFG